jgi:hypothetical protein
MGNDLPAVRNFTEEEISKVAAELRRNPYAGRTTAMHLLGTKNSSGCQELVRTLKTHLGLDPSDRRNPVVMKKQAGTEAEGSGPPADASTERLKMDAQESELVLEAVLPGDRYSYAETIPHLLDAAEVDTDKWDVYRKVVNRWGSAENPCWQVKAWLKPVEVDLAEQLLKTALDSLAASSKPMAPLNWTNGTKAPGHARRALEISIMDPHLGGVFYAPASEHSWDLDQCVRLWRYGIAKVLERAAPYGPFERLVFPLGNDFMHADNVFHTTTAGTGQPEMAAIHHVACLGEQLLIQTIEELAAQVPHIDVLFVPGNHSRWTEFMMARCVKNRFHNNKRVHVNDEPTPYKGWRYGVNLLGFEHGHSAAVVRLAAVMATEWPQWWAQTEGGYREWHLGDQHRKGSGNKLTYEEQGVSVQGLPGLTPANEWHKIKTFSRQKRVAATGFVWDYHEAKLAELPICLDGATGEPFVVA